MKNAFTMIELIFVIVILGILAAVAIPKLAATRTDAVAASMANNLATCVNGATDAYMMDVAFDVDSDACDDVRAACFDVDGDDNTGILTVKDTADTTAICVAAHALANGRLSAPAPAGIEHHF